MKLIKLITPLMALMTVTNNLQLARGQLGGNPNQLPHCIAQFVQSAESGCNITDLKCICRDLNLVKEICECACNDCILTCSALICPEIINNL